MGQALQQADAIEIPLRRAKETEGLDAKLDVLKHGHTRNGEEDTYLVGFRGGLQRDKKASEDTERPLISRSVRHTYQCMRYLR